MNDAMGVEVVVADGQGRMTLFVCSVRRYSCLELLLNSLPREEHDSRSTHATCLGMLADMTFSFELFEWSRRHIIHRHHLLVVVVERMQSGRALTDSSRRADSFHGRPPSKSLCFELLVRSRCRMIYRSQSLVRSYASSSQRVADFVPT